MRTLLICHEDSPLTREGIARWLASFSELVGIMVLREGRGRMWRRIRSEIRRVGPLRFLDVLAFRAYRALVLARRDRAWARETLGQLCRRYPPVPDDVPVLLTASPNSPEAERFVRDRRADLMIARCKVLLAERVFTIPSHGTFVFHPGICPEYRNAHGCFWALANGDHARVGMTLLRIDRGVDTGPVYGYYGYPCDELRESPTVIHHRVVLDNLDRLREKLLEIWDGSAVPLDTSGRDSRAWGQPWLSRYLAWKRDARRRAYERAHAPVS
jgi:hypothetical protein